VILIAGAQADVDTQGWPPLARHIYFLKNSSPYVFRYSSLRHLQFEMFLRAAIVQAARDLNDSGVEFATFEYARCNERYWRLTPLGGFMQRPDVKPADAIRDIYRNGPLYAFECATAIPIVYYKAVLDVLGDETFNRLFQNLLLYSWNYDSDLGLIQERVSPERAFPGDVLYFNNPDFHPRAPEWQGVNVVMLDDDVFYGHGVGITSGLDIIIGLNMRRRPFSFRSAYLMDLIVYPDFEYLSRYMPPLPSAVSGAASQSAAASSPIGSASVLPGLAGTQLTPMTAVTPPAVPHQPGGEYAAWDPSFSSPPGTVPTPWTPPHPSSPPSGLAETQSSGSAQPPASDSIHQAQPGDVRPADAQPADACDPPWLSLPPADSSRIRARVGRRRTIA